MSGARVRSLVVSVMVAFTIALGFFIPEGVSPQVAMLFGVHWGGVIALVALWPNILPKQGALRGAAASWSGRDSEIATLAIVCGSPRRRDALPEGAVRLLFDEGLVSITAHADTSDTPPIEYVVATEKGAALAWRLIDHKPSPPPPGAARA